MFFSAKLQEKDEYKLQTSCYTELIYTTKTY